MFNQLMLQNIKKKVVQIAESDSESSNSEEGKNDSKLQLKIIHLQD